MTPAPETTRKLFERDGTLSGAIDAPTLQAALGRGVNGFIVKPFNADTVLKTLRSAVLAMIRKQQGA